MKSSTFDSGLSSQDHDSFIMRDKVVAEKSADRSNFCSCKKEKCMHAKRNSCSERRWKSYVITSVIMAFHNVQQIILYCGGRMILKS